MDRRLSTLSAPRQWLLHLMRQLNFGTIENLTVNGGEPMASPPPKIIQAIKLGLEPAKQAERKQADFELKSHIIELFSQFDQLKDESIVTIECRHGLPARLIVERKS
jgi:hypothetical protein